MTIARGFTVAAVFLAAVPLLGQPKPSGEVNTPPARDERHRDRLKVGDAAPDFTLPDPSGKKEVRLSSFKDRRPVVLIFGSLT
jgi:hypothetical protein